MTRKPTKKVTLPKNFGTTKTKELFKGESYRRGFSAGSTEERTRILKILKNELRYMRGCAPCKKASTSEHLEALLYEVEHRV